MPYWFLVIQYTLLAAALFFFTAGTIGILRFPDLYARLHALTKCDNLGLGFVVLALSMEALAVGDGWLTLKLVLIWTLALASSATACYLVARSGLRAGQTPWTRPPEPVGHPVGHKEKP